MLACSHIVRTQSYLAIVVLTDLKICFLGEMDSLWSLYLKKKKIAAFVLFFVNMGRDGFEGEMKKEKEKLLANLQNIKR